MDDADRAQLCEQKERELAIDAIKHRTVDLPLSDDTGARICVDCDERIPHARLLAYPQSIRCIDCQADAEKALQHRAI